MAPPKTGWNSYAAATRRRVDLECTEPAFRNEVAAVGRLDRVSCCTGPGRLREPDLSTGGAADRRHHGRPQRFLLHSDASHGRAAGNHTGRFPNRRAEVRAVGALDSRD